MFGCVWAGLGILFVWAYREVLAWYPFLPHRCGLVSGGYFPSFWEGLSLRRARFGVEREAGFGISLPFGRDFH